jgi:hypothetical protein
MMAQDLREMLHRTVADPPPDQASMVDVLEAGRRRVRRRRTGIGAAVALAAAAAVATPALLVGIGDGPGEAAGPVQPVGKVVHLSDAVGARAGTDYEVLTRLPSGNLDRANGTSLGPVTDDGLVVVQEGPQGSTNWSRWGLLDPTTGRTRWFPDVRTSGAPDTFVGLDDDRLVMLADSFDTGRTVLWVADRSTMTWRTVELDTAGTGLSFERFAGMKYDDGRFYFQVRPRSGVEDGHLWSASVEGDHAVRDEGVDVGTFDVEGGVLSFMRYDNRPTSDLHVRDLATGEEHTYDTRSGRRCNQLGMQRVGENIVLSQYCGERNGVRDDRTQVVTTTGEPVVTLQGDGLEAAGASDRFVLLTSYRHGAEGAYVWDLARERLLRLSDGFSKFAGGSGGSGERLLWSTPFLSGHGREQWVADFR